jgi:hypothetical protein
VNELLVRATEINEGVDMVIRRVQEFAEVSGVPYQTAAVYQTFSQQLNYLRWLEQHLAGCLENYSDTRGAAYADLVRQRRIVSRLRAQFEAAYGEMEKVVTRPLPEWVAGQMMDWVLDVHGETAVTAYDGL